MLAALSHRSSIIVFLLAISASNPTTGLAADAPLNLLIISTDEHHFSTLGCYCGTIVETPVTTNNTPLDDSIVTFAEILGRNGYATGHASKRSSGISQLCDT